MSRMIYGEAEINFPKPLHELVADQVRSMFDGIGGVKTADIARAMNRQVEPLMFHLNKAMRLGLIARARDGSWFPL